MLTLLGSLLGFLSSFAPKLLDRWQDAADKSHELAMMDKQKEIQLAIGAQQLQEVAINAEAAMFEAAHTSDRPTGIRWVEALRGTVRPVITYAFFMLFAAVEISVVLHLLHAGDPIREALPAVWTEEMQALFATILAFWFGGKGIESIERLPWRR